VSTFLPYTFIAKNELRLSRVMKFQNASKADKRREKPEINLFFSSGLIDFDFDFQKHCQVVLDDSFHFSRDFSPSFLIHSLFSNLMIVLFAVNITFFWFLSDEVEWSGEFLTFTFVFDRKFFPNEILSYVNFTFQYIFFFSLFLSSTSSASSSSFSRLQLLLLKLL
jgi:hypothetical protein